MEDLRELEVGIAEREELMVSPSGDVEPTMRVAHFLQPTVTSIDGPVFELPAHCLSSIPDTFQPKDWPLKLTFHGWTSPGEDWKIWVGKMASLHESTWKMAGIYEAILNSTYSIQRNRDLVLGLAEKWCPETKSFIFSWGEATITLEDMIISGFSVLGSSVFSPLELGELRRTAEKLNQARTELGRTAGRKVGSRLWKKKFMDSGSEIEHEAFLAFWLSRFVFPASSVIARTIFPIAIHLARGTRIALAPAVLAAIYRDLSVLKEKIVVLAKLGSNCEDECSELAIILRSPLQLVQIWGWERFIELRPKPNLIKLGEPRFAQWHKTMVRVENVRKVLDSAQESFDWRPYAKSLKNWSCPKFYAEKEMWVSVNSDLGEEFESFSRCLRVSEIVGRGCIEHYFPHRVAMQFGLDQDLPACVAQASDYSKPICYANLYIPTRLYEADVTTRYLEWWKQSVSHLQGGSSKGVLLLERTFRGSKIAWKKRSKTAKRVNHMNEGVILSTPKMLSLQHDDVSDASASVGLSSERLQLSQIIEKELNESPSPPGFPLKTNLVEAMDKGTANDSLFPPGFPPKSCGSSKGALRPKRTFRIFKISRKTSKRVKGFGFTGFKIQPKRLMATMAGNFTKSFNITSKKLDGIVKGDGGASSSHPGFALKSSEKPLQPSTWRKKDIDAAEKSVETSKEVDKVCDMSSSVGLPSEKKLPLSVIVQNKLNDSPLPSGFPAKSNPVEAEETNMGDDDKKTISELLRSSKRHGQLGDGEYPGNSQTFSSSMADKEVARNIDPLTALIEKITPNATAESELEAAKEDATATKACSPIHDMESFNEYEAEIQELQLEERVSRLERIFAELKEKRHALV